jgi:hypothetical protein
MLVKKTLKNGKCSVTSSHFEDIRVYRQSLAESKQEDYVPKKWRKAPPRDFSEAEAATVTQCLLHAKMAAQELSQFVECLKPNQLENYKINYGCLRDYESYEDLVAIRDELEAKENLEEAEQEELQRVTKEIKSYDDFVTANMEAMAQGYSLNPEYLKEHPECAMPKKQVAE